MIHASAVIDPRAQIDPTVEIGPFVVIDGPARLASGVVIGAHAQIVGDTFIGAGTKIGRAAIIGEAPQDLSFDAATASQTIIGENNVIREQVTIHRGSKPGSATRVGNHNFIMANAHLAHDVQVGDHNVLANAALLAGHIELGSHTFIGGGAVFHQFLRIGDYCVVQGNGSFSKDIPHYCAAQRINRVTGLNVVGLRRQGFTATDRAAIKELFRLLFCSGMNLSDAVEEAAGRAWPEKAARLLEFVRAPNRKGVCSVRAAREDN